MRWGILGANGLLAASASLILVSNVSADVSGKVFRDLNANGVLDSGSEFNENGVAGITVKAFDSTGAEVGSALSMINGDYNLIGVTGSLRIEFTGLLMGDYSSAPGTGVGSSVRFLTAPATNINYALNYPNDYCVADPKVIIPAHYAGDGTGSNSTKGGLHSFPYSSSGGYSPNNKIELTKAQLGSVWGIAYDKSRKRVFGASFLKRHVGLKDGLGSIYISETQVDGSLNLVGSFNLQGITAANTGTAIDLGNVCRSASCANDAGNTGIATDYIIPADPATRSIDLDSFAKVGKAGFGGIEITPDNKTVWAVNLYQRSLLRMDASLSTASFPGAVQSYGIDDTNGAPSCNGGVFRPFGLTFYRDKGYLGGVCDASISKQSADLKAYVLAFDPNASSLSFSTITSIDLNYNRGSDWMDGNARYYWQWHPWMDVWSEFNISNDSWLVYHATPILSDIAFSEDGSMSLAFMDRFSHQIGRLQYRAVSQTTNMIDGRSRGDLVHLCKNAGSYYLEGSVECPVNFAGGEGPKNNGEYFNDVGGDTYSENSIGSILYLQGSNEMLATMFDPFPPWINGEDPDSFFTQGIHALNAKNGNRVDYFRVANALGAANEGGFGKGSGLGELELLCPPAPVELGNRVWDDKDKDGIQDADELGLAGVNVALTCPSGTASTSTDSNGQFVFTNAIGGNASFLQAGENCKISIDNSQAVLTSYELTKTNADGESSNNEQTDLRDSDASLNGSNAELAFIVGSAGANNHSLDFGYREPLITDVKLNKIVTPAQAKHGEQVIYTLTVTNESQTTEANNIKITDQLPAGVNYVSDDGVAQYGTDVFDEVTGIWTVNSVAAGATKTLKITVQIQ